MLLNRWWRAERLGHAKILLCCLGAIALLTSVSSFSPAASAVSLQWSVAPSPNPSTSLSDNLSAVSCISLTECVAVGDYYVSENHVMTLIEAWNGSNWSITPHTDPSFPSTADRNILDGVSCVSGKNYCVAIGSISTSSVGNEELFYIWNGSGWTESVGSPNSSDYLNGVSCVSATDCMAVGDSATTTLTQTLAETWNGKVWTVVSSPNVGNFSQLNSVSCIDAQHCVAVGYDGQGTLIETWNGTTWSISPSPSPSTSSQLQGISCALATGCVAVGYYVGNTENLTLVEIWNGGAWTVSPSPNPSTSDNELNGVSCVTAANCTAVGSFDNDVNTLVETWAGGTWTQVASPNRSTGRNVLSGVSCTDLTDCTSVGTTYAPLPQPDHCHGVTCSPGTTLVEVGEEPPPPTTSILVPSSQATLSGSTYLDASASNATTVKFLLLGGSYGYNAPTVCTATPTYYGWLCSWNTVTVPNGSYLLVSEASGPGGNTYSAGVGITVKN
jgi:Bacterial Ig domain